jgi:glycosyltransferase involved in cell wall biosynthesis
MSRIDMDKIKVLFLTRSYPDTKRSATTLCTHRVIECVSASERNEVHVLCLRYKGEIREETCNGVYVHRFNPSLWTRIKNRVIDTHRYQRLERFWEKTQKMVAIPYFPRTEPLTTHYYLRDAIRLHKKKQFDLVFSEHHCLATLISGCKLKSLYPEIRHIAAFWDPLKGERQTSCLPSRFVNRRIEALETYVANNTTIEVSMAIMKDYFKKENDVAYDHRVFLDIPTLLKPEPEVQTEYLSLLRDNAINIVYSGALATKQRNPLPIIRLLNQCRKAERINLVFFSKGAEDALNAAIKEFKGTIIRHDYIPIRELHTIYRHSDYLLNISHINPNMVPSKLFEYISYGKPIISAFVTDGDAAQRCISRYPDGISVDLKKEEKDNIALLDDFFGKNHEKVPFHTVKESFKESTPESYLELIGEVLSHKQ